MKRYDLNELHYEEIEQLKAQDTKEDFEFFSKKKTTVKQKREIAKIEDLDKLFIYLVCSYNCYAITHSKGQMSLIHNPEALFFKEEEKTEFAKQILQYAKDYLKTNRKEIGVYAVCTDNTTERETNQN